MSSSASLIDTPRSIDTVLIDNILYGSSLSRYRSAECSQHGEFRGVTHKPLLVIVLFPGNQPGHPEGGSSKTAVSNGI